MSEEKVETAQIQSETVDHVFQAANRAQSRRNRPRVFSGVVQDGDTHRLWMGGKEICSGTYAYCEYRRKAGLASDD